MIAYSPLTGGFYDTQLHGERALLIPDPQWQRPLVTVTLQPGESSPDGFKVNETTKAITVELPDEKAVHPLIEVPNLECLLPADAVEITPERHAELLAGNALGKLIVADKSGLPTLQEAPPPTVEQFVSQAAAKRSQLLQAATQAIAPLQDAVDFGEATEAEEAALQEWKRYRIALTRVSLQDSYPNEIQWPSSPA